MLLARRTCDWLLPTPPTPLKQLIVAPLLGGRHGVVEDLDLPVPREGSGIEVDAVAARVVDDVVRQEQVGVGRWYDVDAVPPDVVDEVVADVELVAHRRRAEDDAVGGGPVAPLDLHPLQCHVIVEEKDGPEADVRLVVENDARPGRP